MVANKFVIARVLGGLGAGAGAVGGVSEGGEFFRRLCGAAIFSMGDERPLRELDRVMKSKSLRDELFEKT